MMKIFYLAQSKNGMPYFSPLVQVRTVPTKSTADKIFFCIFPDGGFTGSGLEVIKRDKNSKEEMYDVQEGFSGPIILENVNGSEILEKLSNVDKSHMKG